MDTQTNTEIIQQVKSVLKKVRHTIPIEKALLFGSRARDNWLYTSDVDLLVISSAFSTIPFLDRGKIIYQHWDLPIEFHVVCYTPEEFAKKKMQIGIVQQANLEGKNLL